MGTQAKPELGTSQARVTPPRILLAEDDEDMRALLVRWIRTDGYEVIDCRDGVQLYDYLERTVLTGELADFDLLVSDIRMPGEFVFDVLEELQGCDGLPPTILITAFGDPATHAEARELGALTVFDKPFEMEVLMEEIRRLAPILPSRARENEV